MNKSSQNRAKKTKTKNKNSHHHHNYIITNWNCLCRRHVFILVSFDYHYFNWITITSIIHYGFQKRNKNHWFLFEIYSFFSFIRMLNLKNIFFFFIHTFTLRPWIPSSLIIFSPLHYSNDGEQKQKRCRNGESFFFVFGVSLARFASFG